MNTIGVSRFGIAMGCTAALLRLACVLVMLTVRRETAIQFFNSLTHGVNWASVLRWEMPGWEMALGVVEVFIVAWLVGAAIAAIYNVTAKWWR